MLSFVDSLTDLDYTDDRQPFNPDYSQQQIDSIVALSLEEFEGAIRLAMSLFDNDAQTLRRIIMLTAGPRCITKMNYQFSFQADSSVEITTLSGFAATGSLSGITIPPEAQEFYWPGIPFGNIRQSPSRINIEAVLTTESGKTLTVPVASSPSQQRYSWNFVSPHLDKKLHTVSGLKPQISWRISRNGQSIAELTEEPVVVAMADAIQFGNALAGTERLVSVDGTLPTSLASTLGFVDRTYALLALEEDVMEPLDQEHYRISGVPPLTNADIFVHPDESIPPDKTVDAPATAAAKPAAAAASAPRTAPLITLQKSILTI